MEDEKFEDIGSMLRLKYEKNLMADISGIFEDFAKNEGVYKSCKYYGRKFRKKSLRRAYRLYCQGLKVLDKKVPVYIEVPKLEEQSSGQFKEVYNNEQKSDEQIVHISNLPEQVEDKKEKTKKMIEDNSSFL